MPSSVVIEIGPGRGAWTKAILSRGVEKIYAIDAATPEHTGFWDYIGKSDRVDYFVATDFTLREVPDDCADYFFSFGVFCHIAPEHSKEYITSLHRKMRAGSNGFLMIADFSKYNKLRERIDDYSLLRMMRKKRMALARFGYRISRFFQPSKFNLRLIAEQGAEARPDAWHHFGLDDACRHIEAAGFRVVERDVGANPRDPIIHFCKP